MTCKYTNNFCFLGLPDIDLNVRKNYKKENIKKIDDTLRLICRKNSITYIKMQGLIDDDWLTDGLHPNKYGHEKISEYLYKELYLSRKLKRN